MNRTLSAQQIRLVVLIGLIVVIAAGWFLVIQPRNNSTTTPAPVPGHRAPAQTVPAHTTPATQSPLPTAPTQRTPAPSHTAPSRAHRPTAPVHISPVQPATKPHAATRVTHPTPPGYRFPAAVEKALATKRIVVVSLYTPGVALDSLTRAESKAGAKEAGAGFVALDVNTQRDVKPLLTMLGPIEAPAVLVVRRCCGWTFATFEGFVDRATVAQAVVDARR
jgi:hypothetical protein